jgi:plastocyanin
MNRRRLIQRFGYLAAALAVVPVIQACGEDDESGASSVEDPVIEMTDDLKFEPDVLKIELGQTVTWKNVGSMVHTVTNDPGKAQNPEHAAVPEGASGWDSGLLRSGQSWTHTFDVAGDYMYFCITHEAANMTGKIVVKEIEATDV